MGVGKVLTTLVLAMVTACNFLVTGYRQMDVPADQVATALFALEARDDAGPMKDLLGFASEDDVRESLMEGGSKANFVDELKEELADAGIDFTDDELQAMTDQLMGLLSKLKCTAEITDQSGEETIVVLHVKGYSMADVGTIATDLAMTSLSKLDEDTRILIATGDEEATMKYMQQFMKDYIAAMSAMEPTQNSDITVKMEKMKVDVSGKTKLCWWPIDMSEFEDDLNNSFMN